MPYWWFVATLVLVAAHTHHHHDHLHRNRSTDCTPAGAVEGPGGIGGCPTPTASRQQCPLQPTYLQLAESKTLWKCPGAASNEWSGKCTPGAGGNPLCKEFDPTKELGCCCPAAGCYVTPEFNWIISTCQGRGCGDYFSPEASELRQFKDHGSELVINYVATYQYDPVHKHWVMLKDSSYNTDASKKPFHASQPNGGFPSAEDAWLQPQPGGAASWSWGYYPAGVSGAKPPGMMFVLSTEQAWNFAWYMLNKVTLDRGPWKLYPPIPCPDNHNDNCWSAGNAGELDFLESPWTNSNGKTDDYRRLYATQWNQIGRWFTGQMGSTCNADGGWFQGDMTSNNYFLGTPPNATGSAITPYVWVAVVDSVGTFIYRLPGKSAHHIWPGLSSKKAACKLTHHRPRSRPPNNGPPCRDDNPYCALFMPNCQQKKWGGAAAGDKGAANAGCKVNAQQGWCGNWWTLFNDTQQWQWPENGTPSVTQFQYPAKPVVNPWNYQMEAWKVDWQGNAIPNGGCCVNGKGHCPKSTNKTTTSTATP
eukprot:TRINITY_DN115161_c0_g1_i1.p1 TRINITY_DN115161_c0_g1~~TRINITY_DN115161_c0_g1_i1.p1  ORF type:complete len:533 (+),score=43.22 TRINITY_DN115161_c0_g1_i1:62-1660(+)